MAIYVGLSGLTSKLEARGMPAGRAKAVAIHLGKKQKKTNSAKAGRKMGHK